MSQRRADDGDGQLIRPVSTNSSQRPLSTTGQPSDLLKLLVVRVWQSPRGKTAIGLWILGLLFMYLAPAPMPISPESQDRYETLVHDANNLDKFGDTLAELQAAKAHMYEAQVWFWRWRSPAREIVLERQAQVDKLQAQVDELNVKREEMLNQANNHVGIWSEYGLAEARERFWSAFESGKVFATRQTFWQMLFSLPNTRDNVLATFLEWILTALINFTLGLIGSLFYFVFSLGSMIFSFSPNPISGILFYLVALLGAVSVVVTYLAGIYGLGAGGVFILQKVAVRQMQLKYEQQRAALGRDHRQSRSREDQDHDHGD